MLKIIRIIKWQVTKPEYISCLYYIKQILFHLFLQFQYSSLNKPGNKNLYVSYHRQLEFIVYYVVQLFQRNIIFLKSVSNVKKIKKIPNITEVLSLEDWSTGLWWQECVGKSIWLWLNVLLYFISALNYSFQCLLESSRKKFVTSQICDKDEILRRWDWTIPWMTGANPYFYKAGILFCASSWLLLEL